MEKPAAPVLSGDIKLIERELIGLQLAILFLVIS